VYSQNGLYFFPYYSFSLLPGVSITILDILLICTFYLYRSHLTKPLGYLVFFYKYILIALIVPFFISLITNSSSLIDIVPLVRLCALVFLIIPILWFEYSKKRDKNRLMVALFVVVIFCSVLQFVEVYTGTRISGFLEHSKHGEDFVIYIGDQAVQYVWHRAIFFLLPILFISYSLFLSGRSRRLYGSLAAITLLSVILTYVRQQSIFAFLGLFILSIFHYRKLLIVTISMAFFLIYFFATMPETSNLYFNRISTLKDIQNVNTGQHRLNSAEFLWENEIKDNFLFGGGINEHTLEAYNSDLGFYNILLFSGLFGVVLISLMLFKLLYKISKALKVMNSSYEKCVVQAVFAYIIVVIAGESTSMDYFVNSRGLASFTFVIAIAESVFFQYNKRQLNL